MNLWPAFERVWAPEEVYFPTVMSLCGFLDNYNENDDDGNNNSNNEVSNRSLTYSEWDTRASNHKDRAHPLTYDDNFDYKLVRRVRNENGALFLRKLKRGLDLNVWEDIVVRREKKSVVAGGHHHRGHRDYRQQNDRRHHYDSRRNNFSYGNGSYSRDRDDRRRPFDRDREGSSSKRHRWR
jgi:hypothetical protein